MNKLKKILPYFLLLIPILFIPKTIDNDFWFTINHGRYILNNGFATIEPFTIHPDLSFSFQKWLTSIFFYSIYSTFSETGVMIMTYIIAIIIEILFYINISYISENKFINIISTFLVCSALFNSFITTRPQLFSYIILLLEFWCTEHYARTKEIKYLLPLPLFSWIYIQMHSTMWPIFFIMLMPYIFDFPLIAKKLKLRKSRYKKTYLIIIAVICFLIGFVNPYGHISVFYLFNSKDVNINIISELTKTNFFELLKYSGLILVPHIFYWLSKYYAYKNNFYKKNGERSVMLNTMPLRYIYILLGTLLMAIFALRNISHYVIFGGIITAYMFEKSDYFDIKNMYLFGIIGLIMFVIYIPTCLNWNTSPNCKPVLDIFYEICKKDNVDISKIRLYTNFNTGSYAEWKGFKTYIDPRAEIFTKKINNKKDILLEYKNLEAGKLNYSFLQKKYNFDYWLLSEKSPINTYIINDQSYKKLIEKEGFIIYKYIAIQ